MSTGIRKKQMIERLPPWMFVGALLVLVPLFAFITITNINRQKESYTRLLLEKGAALIRSFEAGARTGMMAQHWSGRKLQKLLMETAQQPDIRYLMVTDSEGVVIAHNDPARIGQRLADRRNDWNELLRSAETHWRMVTSEEKARVFEVYRRFTPSIVRHRRWHGPMMRHGPMEGHPPGMPEEKVEQIIYVGLDMASIETAQQADIRQILFMGMVLLLAGLAGILLLFLFQGYRSARSSLTRIQEFSDHLVANMPIGLITIGQEGRVVSCNPAAASLLAISAADLVGRRAEKALPPELLQPSDDPEGEKTAVEREISFALPDGRTAQLELQAGNLPGEGEIAGGRILLLKDLREVASLRREIARSQRLATVGRLAGGVAHEIRNPLSSIKGFATYFKERYRDVAEDQQIADIMIQEVDRMNRVVGQLLEFARPVKITPKPVEANAFLTESLRLVERQASEKEIRIVTRLLPVERTVSIDPDRLRQVLLNLYLNAIEAMTTGDEMTVGISIEMGELRIDVADTGDGIPPEALSKVFDPYYTTKPSGTGIGLAMVHNILEAHGGKIEVSSEPGRGTVFTVRLTMEKAIA